MKLFHEYTALDIGTYSVKLLSLVENENYTYSLQDAVETVLPVGMVTGGFTNPMITSEGKFSRLLQEQIGRLSRKKEGFIIGLPDRWIKLNLVDLSLRGEELTSEEYLGWRLKKMFCSPATLNDVTLDYQILSTIESDGLLQCRILAGMVQKSIIDILSVLLMRLQIPVMAFDTSTLGVYNLLEENHPDRSVDRELIMCHIGHETTVVKVFEHGILRYERVIEVGGEAFSQLLGEMENLPFDESQKAKIRRKFFPLSREEIFDQLAHRNTFEKVFGNWLRELTVTFRFYQDKFKIMKLPSIYLTGGSSLFEGLPEFMADFFETKCLRFNPLRDLVPGAKKIDEFLPFGPTFAPCLGLLVR